MTFSKIFKWWLNLDALLQQPTVWEGTFLFEEFLHSFSQFYLSYERTPILHSYLLSLFKKNPNKQRIMVNSFFLQTSINPMQWSFQLCNVIVIPTWEKSHKDKNIILRMVSFPLKTSALLVKNCKSLGHEYHIHNQHWV